MAGAGFPSSFKTLTVETLTITGTATFASTVTVTGQFLAGDGTVGAPSYSFASDPDTGFYWNSSGIAAFGANGVIRIVFNAASIGLGSTGTYYWTSGAAGTAADLQIGRLAASNFAIFGITGAKTQIKQATTLLSAVSGATVTATGLIPAKAKVFGVVTRVTTGLGTGNGTTGYAVGTAGDPNLWGDVVGTIAGTDTDNSDATADPSIAWSSAAQDVVITAAGGNFNGTGAIRVIVLYWDTGAPTS